MIQILTIEEESKLLRTLNDAVANSTARKRYQNLRDLVMILLGLRCGLRVGEVQKLHVSHVWAQGAPVRSIHIPAGFNKNCLDAWIPVPPELYTALGLYLPARIYHADLGDLDPLLLVSWPGKKPRNPVVTRPVVCFIMQRWATAAGIRRVKFHALRHTYATRFLQTKNVNLRTVQQLLRHRSLTSTQIYTHPNQDDMELAVMQTFPGPQQTPP